MGLCIKIGVQIATLPLISFSEFGQIPSTVSGLFNPSAKFGKENLSDYHKN